jgi:hypothetical protein
LILQNRMVWRWREDVDPATLLVTALATGAATGVGETATAAVKDAYGSLKRLVAFRFAGHPSYEVVLAEHENHPEVWRAPLAQAVTESGAATDPAVVEAAERLMVLLDAAGARAGKYSVDLRGAQGIQVGDHNQQSNTFTTPPVP